MVCLLPLWLLLPQLCWTHSLARLGNRGEGRITVKDETNLSVEGALQLSTPHQDFTQGYWTWQILPSLWLIFLLLFCLSTQTDDVIADCVISYQPLPLRLSFHLPFDRYLFRIFLFKLLSLFQTGKGNKERN